MPESRSLVSRIWTSIPAMPRVRIRWNRPCSRARVASTRSEDPGSLDLAELLAERLTRARFGVEERAHRARWPDRDAFGLVAVLPDLRPRVHQERGKDGHDEVRQHDPQVPQRIEVGPKGRDAAEGQCADDDVASEDLKADGGGNQHDDRSRHAGQLPQRHVHAGADPAVRTRQRSEEQDGYRPDEHHQQNRAQEHRPQQRHIVRPQWRRCAESLATQGIVVGQVLPAGAGRHRRQRAQGEHRDDGPEQVDPRHAPIRPVPVEANVAPGSHAGVESHRPIDDPWIDRNEHDRDDRLRERADEPGPEIDCDCRDGNQPALQDRHAGGVVLQPVSEDDRVSQEVAGSPDLRPGRVDAHGQYGEHRVREPDPEILGRVAGEFDR